MCGLVARLQIYKTDRKVGNVMYTYEMVGVADENGKTYECDWGTYSKKDGFKFPNLDFGDKQNFVESFVNQLMHSNVWKLKKEPRKKMTLEDIERELGYKIELCDTPKKEEENTDDDINIEHLFDKYDTIADIFSSLFGRKIDR